MSRNKPSSNPFDDDDDNYGNSGGWRSNNARDFDEAEARLERIMEQKRASQNRQLDSCNRALSSIYDSERIGIATADELLHQGEQLDNVERKTEEIDKSLTVSQRHLNHVKSVFGGIKNWFTKKNAEPEPPIPEERPRGLRDTMQDTQAESAKSSSAHPGLRVRDLDTGGFGADAPPPKQQASADVDPYEEDFQEYLGEMSSGISRLKGLGLGLHSEILSQNDQIDRINTNVDKNQLKLDTQNRQMRKILK